MFQRPGRLADHFPPPFANDQAARAANGGALPPDMSVLAKARGFERGFPWFIFDVFTQYQEAGPGLYPRHPQRLRGSARRVHAAAGRAIQQIFPRPRHRHAASR